MNHMEHTNLQLDRMLLIRY